MTALNSLSCNRFNLTSSIFFFYFLLLLTACSKKEDVNPQAATACFTLPNGDLYSGSTISFDASCSNHAKTYQWKFSDNYQASGKIATRVFSKTGDYTVTLTVTDSLGRTFTKDAPFSIKPSPYIIHEGTITANEVWAEGLHLVRNDVTISGGGIVTIAPGATVYFNKGTSIFIGDTYTATTTQGTLKAIGTLSKPISFIPVTGVNQPAEWGHLYFTKNAAPTCAMDYCTIKYGGKATFYYNTDNDYLKHGIVDVDHSTVSITNTTITGGANYGIRVWSGGLLSSFTGNTISGNVNNPVRIHVNAAHLMGTGNNIQGNGILLDDWTFLTANATWRNFNIPYVIDSYVQVGNITAPATYHLTLEPGVKVLMTKGSAIMVEANGSLTAEGTATAPIVFSSNETTKAKGDWRNFPVRGQSSFKYCQFEYGGDATYANDPSMLTVYAAGTTVNNCSFTHSATDGAAFYAADLVNSSTNTFSDCDRYAVTVEATIAHNINMTHTFSCVKNIHILASHTDLNVAAVWPKRGFPYYFESVLSIQNNALGAGSLTIAPGVEIRSLPTAGIGVQGTFIADGTTDPIIFTVDDASKSLASNYWGGISFGQGTTANSKLTNCKFFYGGNHPGYPDIGIVDCFMTTNTPTITNNEISNSAGYGLSNHSATPIVSGNTFTLNAKGDIHTY